MKQKTFSLRDFGLVVLFVGLCQLAGGIGAFFTTSQIPGWYQFLEKPALSPPNWLFAPVWILLYTMMGVAVFLIYKYGAPKERVIVAIKWFFAQLALNTLWSIAFFGGNSPLLGLVIIILLWTLIFHTIQQFLPLNKWAGWLLVPYLLWVSFASYLNAMIWWLNN